MKRLAGWLCDVLLYAGSTWPYRKPDPVPSPVYGPPTAMQNYLGSLWEDEILQQAEPVLKFYQFNVNNFDSDGNFKGAPDA
jgi:hypothetical protein